MVDELASSVEMERAKGPTPAHKTRTSSTEPATIDDEVVDVKYDEEDGGSGHNTSNGKTKHQSKIATSPPILRLLLNTSNRRQSLTTRTLDGSKNRRQ